MRTKAIAKRCSSSLLPIRIPQSQISNQKYLHVHLHKEYGNNLIKLIRNRTVARLSIAATGEERKQIIRRAVNCQKI